MSGKIFVCLLITALLTAAPPAEAQQPVSIPRSDSYRTPPLPLLPPAWRHSAWDCASLERPGKNIVIEYRHSEGKPDRLAALVAELVRLKVDTIVTSGPSVTRAAQENDLHDSHCVCSGRRSCRKRFSRQFSAAWRQHYWTVHLFSGATWKTTGDSKGGPS